MNFKMIGRYISFLMMLEAVFLLPSVLVGFIYSEPESIAALLITSALCAGLGFILYLICRKENSPVYARESFVVAGFGWLLLSAFGALPFFISGEIPNYIDAFFETVSGFTTTGASILVNVEQMSHPLLFWRSFTHWLGGVGVLAFLLALVHAQKGSGFTLHLLRAESPGPQVGKMMPKMHQSMRALYGVYIGLSVLNLIFLLAGGMPLFDSFCTMFGTAGTGGFGIKADSMASYSPYLQNVTTVFMALFGVNLSLYFLLLRKQWRAVLRDGELRLYVGIIVVATALITINITPQFASVGQALHHAAFTVSSIITTSGFATTDFNLWPVFARSIILILMICGSMAGSTGGGIKTSRILILFKSIRSGVYRMTHPRSVRAIKMNGKTLEEGTIKGVYLFLSLYCCIALASFLLISIDGMSIETNLASMLSCLNNIGPGLDSTGPMSNYSAYSGFSKIILSINMLLGRLDIFPILLLFIPSTWRTKN